MNLGTIIFDENIANLKSSYESVPDGSYGLILESADVGLGGFEEKKPEHERDNSIVVLTLKWKIKEGEYAKRAIKHDIKINAGRSKVEKDINAAKRGMRDLHQIMGAAGIAEIKSADDLINIMITADVKVKVSQSGYVNYIVSNFRKSDPDLNFNQGSSGGQPTDSADIWA